MPNYIDISANDYTPWSEVLEAVAEIIKVNIHADVTGARVYPYWVYEIDMATLLGTVAPPMYADEGTSAGSVHCWTLGIANVDVVRNQQGENPLIGAYGRMSEWILTLDVWGLRNFDGKHQSQKDMMNEARLVAVALDRNGEKMVSEIPKVSKVSRLTYTALQPTPFSDGKNYSVAAGVMQVNVNEALTT